jgi:predicted nucleic acid-binding protein
VSAPLALDTSVAIPLLLTSHAAHGRVSQWWAGRRVALCGHALVETYSVLTRLPGDARLSGPDAARLIAARCEPALVPDQASYVRLPDLLADVEVVGGAVYDALVALAAVANDAVLASRDSRAQATYERVGARVEMVG